MDNFVEIIKTIFKTHQLPGFQTQLEMAPEYRPLIETSANSIKAAVLVYLFPDEHMKFSLVLMKRPSYDGHHSGQISFPGGKFEVTDKDLIETALRESNEEIGISTQSVEIIAPLSELYIPVSRFMVYPFVAYTTHTPCFKIDPEEVEYLVTISIDELANCKSKTTTMEFRGKEYNVPYFDIHGETVWGATAMILNEFIYMLKKMAE